MTSSVLKTSEIIELLPVATPVVEDVVVVGGNIWQVQLSDTVERAISNSRVFCLNYCSFQNIR